jgi:hypothetical protein
MMKMTKSLLMALLLAAGMAGSVNGAIVYFDFDPVVRVYKVGDTPPYPEAAYSFNPFNHPENGAFNFDDGPVTLEVFELGQGLFWNTDGAGGYSFAASGGTATEFASGATISTGGTTWQDATVLLSQSVSSTTYYGIQDDTGNVGWIQIRRDAAQDYTILGLAYSDTGSIEAGQTSEGGGGGSAVPEPGTAAMLGIGVAILSASRRRFRREG